MTFIPTNIQLSQAVKNNDITKVEELILNSDTKKVLIETYVLENDKEALINILPHFKSRGLVLNIQNILDL